MKSGPATTRDCGCRGWDWECWSGSGASGDASVRRPPSRRRRRRRASMVRGDAMRVGGSYQLWGNLEKNPRMAERGKLMRGVGKDKARGGWILCVYRGILRARLGAMARGGA